MSIQIWLSGRLSGPQSSGPSWGRRCSSSHIPPSATMVSPTSTGRLEELQCPGDCHVRHSAWPDEQKVNNNSQAPGSSHPWGSETRGITARQLSLSTRNKLCPLLPSNGRFVVLKHSQSSDLTHQRLFKHIRTECPSLWIFINQATGVQTISSLSLPRILSVWVSSNYLYATSLISARSFLFATIIHDFLSHV